MRFDEEKMARWTPRQNWEYDDGQESLVDAWKACMARKLEKEEADINNMRYRELHSSNPDRFFPEPLPYNRATRVDKDISREV